MLGRPRLTAAAAGLCPRPPPSSPAVPYLRWRRGVVRRPAGLPLPRRHVRGARPEVSLPAMRGGGWSPSCSTSRRFGRRSRPLGRVTVGRGGALLLPLFQSPRAAVSLAASVLESRRSGRRSRPLVRTLVAASCCLLRWVSVVVWSPDGPSATLPLCSCGGDADPSDASWEALPGESLWTSAPYGCRLLPGGVLFAWCSPVGAPGEIPDPCLHADLVMASPWCRSSSLEASLWSPACPGWPYLLPPRWQGRTQPKF